MGLKWPELKSKLEKKMHMWSKLSFFPVIVLRDNEVNLKELKLYNHSDLGFN